MFAAKILEKQRWLWLAGGLILHVWLPLAAQSPSGYRLLRFQYGIQVPLGDLADRFGGSNSIGGSVEHHQVKSGIFAGLQAMYIFGNNVKEDVLAGLRTSDGSVIGIDGYPGDVALKERALSVAAYGGKIIPLGRPAHPMTGLRTEIGFAFLQHKIRVQDNFTTVVALERENLPGYDRLTNGGALTLAIGYQYHHPLNNIHFHIMAEFIAAATASRRDFDYATGDRLTGQRRDMLGGLRAAWIFTISRKRAAESIIY